MTPQARTLVIYTNFLVAAGIGAWSLYLISMPLHAPADDAHGGLLAAFSGMFLVPVAFATFAAGLLFQRQSRHAWLTQVIALALMAGLVLALIL